MDTETTLKIIQMIDSRIEREVRLLKILHKDEFPSICHCEGALETLLGFKDYLQGFIESQVNAIENQTGE
jgi:hypothetical protein